MKKIVIIGGTGTLGTALIDALLKDEYNRIVCFSRDEHKQKKTRHHFSNHPRLSCVLGDIRDRSSVYRGVEGAYAVFHVAALKHVDTLEEFPEEAFKTNVLGTVNVADACIDSKVPYVMFSSTDKAVAPINAYGYSKALAEKILLQRNLIQTHTYFSVFRWGNIIGSNGSAIPEFVRLIEAGKSVPITDAQMSRFWMTIESAVEFVLSKYTDRTERVKIPFVRSAYVVDVVSAISDLILLNGLKPSIEYVGMRPGEKVCETLCVEQDLRSDRPEFQMSHEELKTLLRPFVNGGV